MKHNGGVKTKCDSCQFETFSKANLKSHLIAQHKGTSFSCDECSYQTGYKYCLTRHNDLVHKGVRFTLLWLLNIGLFIYLNFDMSDCPVLSDLCNVSLYCIWNHWKHFYIYHLFKLKHISWMTAFLNRC